MSSRDSPGVLANGGGSCRTGVLSLSGCVRSTTRTEPSASAVASAARGSVATKCLLQPFGTDVRVDFGVQHQRAVTILEPRAHRVEILDGAGGHAAVAGGLRQGGEVG